MNGKDLVRIQDIIADDGFLFTFVHYSEFKEIKDDKFHELREQFVKATEKLEEYLGVNA